MNNREYMEAYLYWSAEGVDRTVEAFDRHLQAQEDRQTIETVINVLYAVSERVINNSVESDMWAASQLLEAIDQSLEVLRGGHEYVEIQTLTGEDVRMVSTR